MSIHAVMPLAHYTAACDAIRGRTGGTDTIKSGEMPKHINDVFKAGQLDIISNAEALKGSASGTDIISINNISPIEHDIKCTISSDTVDDLSAVKVQRLGKNLFDGELTIWNNQNRIMSKNAIRVKPNTWYTISVSNYTIQKPYFAVHGNHTGDVGKTTDTVLGSQVTTFNSGECEYIWFRQWFSMTADGITLENKVQLEIGKNTVTDYEPYIEPVEYSVNADGTVEGVTSLYPSMTLMTDTEGVIITAQYIKDIDKAFEERLAALEAAIVNNE